MNVKRWFNNKIKKLSMWDYGLVKTYCFLAGMIVGAYYYVFTQTYVWIIVVIVLSIMLKLWMKIFCKKKKKR